MIEPDFERVIRTRRSVRAYMDKPVSRETVERLLALARTAPSGANLQPGSFVVLTGAALTRFSERLCRAIEAGAEETAQYSYFPEPMPKHLKQRQVKLGAQLYEALGIDRKDEAARRHNFMRNYRFFDAPVGMVATIDRRMGSGCFMDFGMAIQTLLLAATAHGLASCGIGALAKYGPIVAELLGLDDHDLVVCGISLGYSDQNAPANQVRSERMAVSDFARFEGWSE